MLSNQVLPYVGRFACDWHRLATTDPLRVHGKFRSDQGRALQNGAIHKKGSENLTPAGLDRLVIGALEPDCLFVAELSRL